MDIVDEQTRLEVEAIRPRVDALRAGLDRGYSPEQLRQPCSVRLAHALVASLTANLAAAIGQIRALEARIEAMESGGIRYTGSYQRALSYRRGDCTTHGGSLWTAVQSVPEGIAPGSSISHWQLSQKAAEDASLKRQISEAREAAAAAVRASAETARRAAARAEADAKQKRLIEKTVVTKHDDRGRILEFVKTVEDAE